MKLIRLLSNLRQYAIPVAAVAVWAAGHAGLAATVSLDFSTAKLVMGPKANSALEFADGTRWPVSDHPAMALESQRGHAASRVC